MKIFDIHIDIYTNSIILVYVLKKIIQNIHNIIAKINYIHQIFKMLSFFQKLLKYDIFYLIFKSFQNINRYDAF